MPIKLLQQTRQKRWAAVSSKPLRATLRHLAVETRGRRSEDGARQGMAQQVGTYACLEQNWDYEAEALQTKKCLLRSSVAAVLYKMQKQGIYDTTSRDCFLQIGTQHTHQGAYDACNTGIRRPVDAQVTATWTAALRFVRRQ